MQVTWIFLLSQNTEKRCKKDYLAVQDKKIVVEYNFSSYKYWKHKLIYLVKLSNVSSNIFWNSVNSFIFSSSLLPSVNNGGLPSKNSLVT